jgi:hypothetical protein
MEEVDVFGPVPPARRPGHKTDREDEEITRPPPSASLLQRRSSRLFPDDIGKSLGSAATLSDTVMQRQGKQQEVQPSKVAKRPPKRSAAEKEQAQQNIKRTLQGSLDPEILTIPNVLSLPAVPVRPSCSGKHLILIAIQMAAIPLTLNIFPIDPNLPAFPFKFLTHKNIVSHFYD